MDLLKKAGGIFLGMPIVHVASFGRGFQLVGLAWLVSGVLMAAGAFLEVRTLLGLIE